MKRMSILLLLITALSATFTAQTIVQPPDNAWCLNAPWLPGCEKPPSLTGVLVDYHGELREVAWYTDKHGVNQVALLEGTW